MLLMRVFHKRGILMESRRVSIFPCYIGRSFDNDIVLADNSISARHAVVELQSGIPVLRDLDSTNGLILGQASVRELPLDRRQQIRMGQLWIEFIAAEEALEDTIRLLPNALRPEEWVWRTVLPFALTLIAAFGLQWLDWLMHSWNKFEALPFAEAGFAYAASILAGAFGLSVLSKVHLRQYQYLSFLWTLLLAFVVIRIAVLLGPHLDFNLNHESTFRGIRFSARALLAYILLVRLGQLLLPSLHRWRRQLLILGIVATLFLVDFSLSQLRQQQSGPRAYRASVGYPLRDPRNQISQDGLLLGSVFQRIEKTTSEDRTEMQHEALEEFGH